MQTVFFVFYDLENLFVPAGATTTAGTSEGDLSAEQREDGVQLPGAEEERRRESPHTLAAEAQDK